MSQKTLIYICLFIGSTLGGAIPMLWGDSALSISAVLLSGLGGMLGIFVGYRIEIN
jgi:hypothetical protein